MLKRLCYDRLNLRYSMFLSFHWMPQAETNGRNLITILCFLKIFGENFYHNDSHELLINSSMFIHRRPLAVNIE